MIQTIDEAILFCEQVTKLKEYRIDEEKEIVYSRLKAPTNDMRPMAEIEKLNRDAERYRQLAEWLRELKTLIEMLAKDIRSCEKILDDKSKNESEHYSARIHKDCCESYLDECIKIKQEEMCKRCRHFVIADGYTETMDGRKIGHWHCELYTIMNIVLDKKCEYEEGADDTD